MHQKIPTKIAGQRGEDLVAKYLVRHGFSLVARNFRITAGEIDLIAKKRDLLIFVEVKLRKSPQFDPESIILASKQRKIIYAAKTFLARYEHSQMICRFDVALVVGQLGNETITYLEDAFRAGE